MKDGYWINYRTGKTFPIDEHEDWVRAPGNAKKLGLSSDLIEAFGKFKPKRDRDKFLLFLMKHAPIMRVRGHGSYITFEYSSRDRNAPIEEIWLFGKQNAGPFTTMYINNFATGEHTTVQFKDMEELMETGGPEALMRVAKTTKAEVKRGIVAELLAIAKELGMKEDA